MLKPKYLALCCLTILLLGLSSCSDDDKLSTAEFSSTTMPSEIPWTGGEYQFAVTPKAGGSVLPWSYRVVIDQEIVKIEENVSKEEITFLVDRNFTAKKRNVRVECNYDKSLWKVALNFNQDIGLVKVGPNYWSTTNLTIKDGKFELADNPEDLGLMFKHKSKYGILVEGDRYSGTAYGPEPTPVAIADIVAGDVDPCVLATDGKLRLPNLNEMLEIFFALDGTTKTKDGVVMMSAAGGKILFPLAGVCDINGSFVDKNMRGAYWASAISEQNQGGYLKLGLEDSTIDFNKDGHMGSVRCVVNTEAPKYVSHTPETLENSDETEIEIITTPGAMGKYTVALIGEADDAYIHKDVTAENPSVKLVIPENNLREPVIYRIYVNDEYSGQDIIQPAAMNYVMYVSHTPETPTVPVGAFDLSVTVDTDMDAVQIEIKLKGEVFDTKMASKEQPTVTFAIPENERSKAKEYTIWVKGKDTNQKVTQDGAILEGMAVLWSEGYLTVKDGKYVFAKNGERPLFFKFKSSMGAEIITKQTEEGEVGEYSGFAYGPEKKEIAYDDIAVEDIDPCALVEPLSTWRLPTPEDFIDLVTYRVDKSNLDFKTYSDGVRTVEVYPTGVLQSSGKYGLKSYTRLWTSSLKGELSSMGLAANGTIFKDLDPSYTAPTDQGLGVRCVQDR